MISLVNAVEQKKNNLEQAVIPSGTLELIDSPKDDGSMASCDFLPGNKIEEVASYFLYAYMPLGNNEPKPEDVVKEINGEKYVQLLKKELVNLGVKFTIAITVPGKGTKVVAQVYGVINGVEQKDPIVTKEVITEATYLDTEKLKPLIGVLFFVMMVIYFVRHAKKGKDLFIRKIAGLDAIDDAIGRATEMGKPVFYIPGTGYIEDIATLASLNILRPVAQQIAKYETPLRVPNSDAIVLSIAQDVTKEAYISAGRADLYNDNIVFLASVGQFAYAGAVSGMMVREKPATVFLMGIFNAESLIFAETANSVGAIQIAGTDKITQLPFFIAACDYTLIGEELYAASAYLSREPLLLGTLKAQDFLKGILIGMLFLALIFNIFGSNFIAKLLLDYAW